MTKSLEVGPARIGSQLNNGLQFSQLLPHDHKTAAVATATMNTTKAKKKARGARVDWLSLLVKNTRAFSEPPL